MYSSFTIRTNDNNLLLILVHFNDHSLGPVETPVENELCEQHFELCSNCFIFDNHDRRMHKFDNKILSETRMIRSKEHIDMKKVHDSISSNALSINTRRRVVLTFTDASSRLFVAPG